MKAKVKSKVTGLLLILLSVMVTGIGCGHQEQSEAKEPYELFREEYENVAENFKPEGFEEFGDGQDKYSGTGFPENDFFPNKDDIIDDNMMNATKRHLFYRNDDNSMIIYITHMYSEKELDTRLVTYDVAQNESEEEDIGYFEEYYMTFGHTYANLKCFHLKEKEGLHDTTNTILQSYADILKIAE